MLRAYDDLWRIRLLAALAILIPFWALLGATGWSGAVRRASPYFRSLCLPPVLANWPAHSATLVMMGHSPGTNRLTPLSPASLAVHFVWSLLFWLPMILAANRRFPRWPMMAGQIALFAIILVTFFRWGNG